MPNYLGIEIGGTKLQLVVVDEHMKIIQRFRHQVDKEKGAAGIQKDIVDALQKISVPLAAAGVGFGGPIDRQSGKIFTSYHIKGWTDFSLKDWLQETSGLRVEVDNDANVAALGETLFGSGKGVETVFYVTIGSGVGAGLVQNGRIYHGSMPGESEFGHIRLDKGGKTLQSSCSGWAVDEKIREAVKADSGGVLAALTKGMSGNEARVLREALEQGDLIAERIFESTMDDLAFGLSHAIHLFHPDIIVLGGGLSLMGELLQRSVHEKCQNYLMDAFQPELKIQLAALKEDAVTVGAAALAKQIMGQNK